MECFRCDLCIIATLNCDAQLSTKLVAECIVYSVCVYYTHYIYIENKNIMYVLAASYTS